MPNFSSVAEVVRVMAASNRVAAERGGRGQLIGAIEPGEWRSAAAVAYPSEGELPRHTFPFPWEPMRLSSSE